MISHLHSHARTQARHSFSQQSFQVASDVLQLIEGVFYSFPHTIQPAIEGGGVLRGLVVAFGYGYDPERSRALLAEVAFDTGAEIVLLIPESNTYRELAAAVQQQLAAVGLTQVCIREALRTEVLALRQDFDLLLFDYAWNDYTILGILLGPGPRNLLNYASDDVAGLVAQARTTADLERRQQLVLDAQRAVLEQAIWQPLLVRRLTFAVDGTCVHGEQQSPAGALLFYNAQTAPW